MKPAALAADMAAYIRNGLKADPFARVCVALVSTRQEQSSGITFALANNADRNDMAMIADTLLRHIADEIINGAHPGCENCREQLKRLQAARAALGFEQATAGLAS
jgi:hypothetical protein